MATHSLDQCCSPLPLPWDPASKQNLGEMGRGRAHPPMRSNRGCQASHVLATIKSKKDRKATLCGDGIDNERC